jgi:hypothetical protein
VVTSQSSKPEKQTAIIIAEEKGSGVGQNWNNLTNKTGCLTMTIFNEFGQSGPNVYAGNSPLCVFDSYCMSHYFIQNIFHVQSKGIFYVLMCL